MNYCWQELLPLFPKNIIQTSPPTSGNNFTNVQTLQFIFESESQTQLPLSIHRFISKICRRHAILWFTEAPTHLTTPGATQGSYLTPSLYLVARLYVSQRQRIVRKLWPRETTTKESLPMPIHRHQTPPQHLRTEPNVAHHLKEK